VWGETEYAAGNSVVLGGTFWSKWVEADGSAQCFAALFYFDQQDRSVVVATTTFDVS
jgi:hypothetical protein